MVTALSSFPKTALRSTRSRSRSAARRRTKKHRRSSSSPSSSSPPRARTTSRLASRTLSFGSNFRRERRRESRTTSSTAATLSRDVWKRRRIESARILLLFDDVLPLRLKEERRATAGGRGRGAQRRRCRRIRTLPVFARLNRDEM